MVYVLGFSLKWVIKRNEGKKVIFFFILEIEFKVLREKGEREREIWNIISIYFYYIIYLEI